MSDNISLVKSLPRTGRGQGILKVRHDERTYLIRRANVRPISALLGTLGLHATFEDDRESGPSIIAVVSAWEGRGKGDQRWRSPRIENGDKAKVWRINQSVNSVMPSNRWFYYANDRWRKCFGYIGNVNLTRILSAYCY